MSRLCSFKLCFLTKNIKIPETLLSRLHFKSDDLMHNVCRSCQRGYIQYCPRLVPHIYPLTRLLDRIIDNRPLMLPAAAREKYERYSNKTNGKYYKRLGMLLGSLGFIVAFCDAELEFKGTYFTTEIWHR